MTLTIKARTIGKALICARRSASIQPDDVARLLKISRGELTLFENGEVEIPHHILESLFALGLTMMHTRHMMHSYKRIVHEWRAMHDRAMELHTKLQKITHSPAPVLKK